MTTGGAFLLPADVGASTFTPERFTAEQRAFHRTAMQFSHREVLPVAHRIDHHEPGLLRHLLQKAGGLGLLGVDLPEAFGGLGLGKVEALLVKEALVLDGSFGVTSGAHTTIGMLPITYFGTPAQQARWLPALITGEKVAAYALTESGSGSDALAARATATRQGDHYVLRGVKQWITNAGFADVFTVFARVDDQAFSAFVVERTDAGVRIGPEEKKMGIRGSSTCELILEDVRIPADRLLGEEGRGHRIALGILNMGRLKLGAGAVGAGRYALQLATAFVRERRQFGQAIADFGLIRWKLGRMAARLHAVESVSYRVAGMVDAGSDGTPRGAQRMLEEYAAECSAVKVLGSEGLALVVDEGVQALGGYGFTEHFGLERLYRDARIHRIFEGTNEINRLVVVGTLLKRARRAGLGVLGQEASVVRPLAGVPEALVPEWRRAEGARALACRALAQAALHLGGDVESHQMVVGPLADLVMEALLMDSVVRRATQVRGEGAAWHQALARVSITESHERVGMALRTLVPQVFPASDVDAAHSAWMRAWDVGPVSLAPAVEAVAAGVLSRGGYAEGA